MNLPDSIWKSGVVHMPTPLTGAHADQLTLNGWMNEYLTSPGSTGSIGGAGPEEARLHFVLRFLNSAARAQYVCSDPLDEQPEIRRMILDQLADGRLFILDLAAGHGAATLAILAMVCQLRTAGCTPKLPINVSISALDHSPDALVYYGQMLDHLTPWLAGMGIAVNLTTAVCDLEIAADVSAELDQFFDAATAQGARRFLSIISAITGVGKETVEKMLDSFKVAASRLARPDRNSSWLWIEPAVKKGWHQVLASAIEMTLKRISHRLMKKGDAYEIYGDGPTSGKSPPREFFWFDPHKKATVKSGVIVVEFRNK